MHYVDLPELFSNILGLGGKVYGTFLDGKNIYERELDCGTASPSVIIIGNEANGIYAIGNKFSFVIGLITTCFTYAWQDLSFSKADEKGVAHAADSVKADSVLTPKEVRIIKILNTFPAKIAEAGAAHSPALVANYAYELAKEFNQYYHDTPILREENVTLLQYRLVLVETIAKVLTKAMSILGINLPERM